MLVPYNIASVTCLKLDKFSSFDWARILESNHKTTACAKPRNFANALRCGARGVRRITLRSAEEQCASLHCSTAPFSLACRHLHPFRIGMEFTDSHRPNSKIRKGPQLLHQSKILSRSLAAVLSTCEFGVILSGATVLRF